MITRRLLLSALAAAALLAVAGCDDGMEGLWVPQAGLPRSPGIWVRDEGGDLRGVWGSPEDGGVRIYPNPGDLPHLEFDVPAQVYVSAWIDRALGPGEVAEPLRPGFGGAAVILPPPAHVRTLVETQALGPGRRLVIWNGRDDRGLRMASGFYRAYVRVGEELLFGDIYYVNPDRPALPPGFDW
jgi:hypothetical protein